MSIIKRSEIPVARANRVPRDRYKLKCIKTDFGPSKSSGHPMITATFEIVGPDSVLVSGEPADVRGKQITSYISFSPKAVSMSVNLLDKLGVQLPEEFDTENIPHESLRGLVVDAIVSSEERASRKEPTPEQAAAGQLGDILKDGEDKDIIAFVPRIESILGVSASQS